MIIVNSFNILEHELLSQTLRKWTALPQLVPIKAPATTTSSSSLLLLFLYQRPFPPLFSPFTQQHNATPPVSSCAPVPSFGFQVLHSLPFCILRLSGQSTRVNYELPQQVRTWQPWRSLISGPLKAHQVLSGWNVPWSFSRTPGGGLQFPIRHFSGLW